MTAQRWQANVKQGRSVYGRMLVFAVVMTGIFFVAGVALGTRLNLGSRNGAPTLAAAVAQLMPEVLQVTTDPRIPAATDLAPLKTFWQVRDRVLRDYVKPLDRETETELTYGAIRGMLSALKDPYTRFMTPEDYRSFHDETEGKFEGIGVVLSQPRAQGPDGQPGDVTILTVFPEGPAAKQGMREGDIVLAVNGQPTRGMTIAEVKGMMQGPPGEAVTVTVRRASVAEPIDIRIVRAKVEIEVLRYKLLEGGVGYIWLRSFNKQSYAKMREAIEALQKQQMRGLVLDLSLNGGGLLPVAVQVAGLFVSGEPVVYVQERDSEPQGFTPRGEPMIPATLPMAVLVDQGTASAAEILAGALQDLGRATIVGTASYGKASVQTVIELDDGAALVLTTAHYLTAHKRDLGVQGPDGKVGLHPDVTVSEPDPKNPPKAEQWREQLIQRARQVVAQKIAAAGPVGSS